MKIKNLNELEESLRRTLGLLEDRQPGFLAWNELLYKQFLELHEYTSNFFTRIDLEK